jgi:1-deoxy-D-xylulose-5-phosphate synthase
VTGDDGPSHNGMWDLSLMNLVPGLRLAAPRDGARLRELLRESVAVDDAPTVVRFPKGEVYDDIPALDRVGQADVVVREGEPDVLVVAVGSMVRTAVDAAAKLSAQGVGVTVVDPRWVKPVDPAVVALAGDFQLVVSMEDNGRSGGVGQALVQALADAGTTTPVAVHAIAQEFLEHDKRDAICEELGLTAEAVAQDTLRRLAHHG